MYAIAVLVSIGVSYLILDPIRKKRNKKNGLCSCGETHVPLSKIVLDMRTFPKEENKKHA